MSKQKFESRCQAALQSVQQSLADGKSWIEANNSIFGVGGLAGELFPTKEDRLRFSKSSEFAEINKILANLMPDFRAKSAAASGKLVIRIPKSMHASLQLEAEAEEVSLNQLIVAKLACQLGELVRR